MAFFLTNQHPVGSNMVRALDDQIRLLRHAREHGWDSAWVGHHYLTDSIGMLQPMPYLARLAPEAGEMLSDSACCYWPSSTRSMSLRALPRSTSSAEAG